MKLEARRRPSRPCWCVAPPLAAQAPEPARAGSDARRRAITAADVARRVGILAHDSMLGRDTPSRGLELTAQYVADQFRRFGLKPGGDDGDLVPALSHHAPAARSWRSRAWCSRWEATIGRPRTLDRAGAPRQRRHSRTAGERARRCWSAAR